MSVRIAGYSGKVSGLLQSSVGGKSVNLHVVCCHASLLQRWNGEKGLTLCAVAADNFVHFYLWKFGSLSKLLGIGKWWSSPVVMGCCVLMFNNGRRVFGFSSYMQIFISHFGLFEE